MPRGVYKRRNEPTQALPVVSTEEKLREQLRVKDEELAMVRERLREAQVKLAFKEQTINTITTLIQQGG